MRQGKKNHSREGIKKGMLDESESWKPFYKDVSVVER